MALVPKPFGQKNVGGGGREEENGRKTGRKGLSQSENNVYQINTTHRNNEPCPYQYVGRVNLNVSEYTLNIRLLQLRQLLRGRTGKPTHKQRMKQHKLLIHFIIYSYDK